jgi:hypothetical protein
MKKIFSLCSVLCLIMWLIACGSGSKNAIDKTTSRMIHGTAATGAYMPDGAIVQVRPAPIPTGQQILVGTTQSGLESWEDEKIPADLITGQVSGNRGVYTIDVSETVGPYLIRIQDPVSLKWYYSYTDGSVETANVNPYTDWMTQYYYRAFDLNVDDSFLTGVCTKTSSGVTLTFMKSSYGFNGTFIYWYGMPLPLADSAQISRAMSELQYVVNLRWNISIGDVLTRNWTVGDTYDTILDGTTLDVPYITTMLNISYCADDMMNYGIAYYDTVNTTLHVELWTTYPYCRADWPDGTGNTDLTLIDTVNGVNHFMREAPYTVKPMQIGIKFNNVPFIPSNLGIALSMTTFDK